MTITISAIYRYPMKGLSPEKLQTVVLRPGRCLPHDRRFAIALPSTRFDPERPEWLSKTHFIMLMRDEKLAQLQTRFDSETVELTVERGGTTVLRESLSEAEGRRRAGAFFDEFLAGEVEGPLRIVEAPDHTFADARRKPNATADQYVSLINLASVAALEQSIGTPVEPLRFRANVYFNGVPPWGELDWLEREIAVGGARLRVVSPITRCAATQVNPATAERDLDITGALQRGFGHNLMGIYAEVIEGGEIAAGDAIMVQ
jgi:uncharacterized protein YcbX